MKKLMAAVVVLAACGGKGDKQLSGTGETSDSVAALDTMLANLEAMRPFVVGVNDGTDCNAYTPAATAALAKVNDATPAATSTRTSVAPDAVTAWQKAHAPAIEKLITEVALPARNGGCPLMETDQTWVKLSLGIVAIAQPADVPAPVTRRRALLGELATLGNTVTTKDDCAKVSETVKTKYATLEKEVEAMSTIERFVDDKVWEEEDEKRMGTEPGVKKLFEICGGL